MRLPIVLALWGLALVPAGAQDFEVDWWTIDGGGEVFSESGEWTLSGTIGQWDASVTAPQAGGGWSLTGGFWAFVSEEMPARIFQDGFETPEPP